MTGIFRRGWWPGLAPSLDTKRVMCSDCRYHSAAMAGWEWDRCSHPNADLGSHVRNDQSPTCADIRKSSAQCGARATWYEARVSSQDSDALFWEAGARHNSAFRSRAEHERSLASVTGTGTAKTAQPVEGRSPARTARRATPKTRLSHAEAKQPALSTGPTGSE